MKMDRRDLLQTGSGDKRISVVIPTYNRSSNIVNSVNSVIAQTYPVSEIIIVDDGSTDDTQDVVAKIQDSRVHYYKLSDNKGAGGARNYGVCQSHGDIIAFQDSDDEWEPSKLEKQMKYMEEHPECGLVYSAYTMELIFEIWHIVPDMEGDQKLEGDILAELLVKNTIGAPTVIMKKKTFEEIGGFDEGMSSLEDWDLVIRVAKKYPIGFVPEVLVKVYHSEGGVSSVKGAFYQSRCYMLRKYRREYLETGMLNMTVQDILEMAKRDGVLEPVKEMLVLYMSS